MYWIVGSGQMAQDYLRVFQGLKIPVKIIGRGEKSAQAFFEKTSVPVITGGLSKFLSTKPEMPDGLVIASNVDTLFECCLQAMDYGIKKILVEKPAALYLSQINDLNTKASASNVDLFIAYNRRFYSSVTALKNRIIEDGGIDTMFFEFTEWSHVIEKLENPKEVMNGWFYANSTHVVDLAFHLGGAPKEMTSYVGGKESLTWHPAASSFVGSGISEKNVLFSYMANWESAGRWSLEICTKKGRYYLKPMEELAFQVRGKIDIQKVEIDNALDLQFKPGLYEQSKAFVENQKTKLCSIEEHLKNFKSYSKMMGEKSN